MRAMQRNKDDIETAGQRCMTVSSQVGQKECTSLFHFSREQSNMREHTEEAKAYVCQNLYSSNIIFPRANSETKFSASDGKVASKHARVRPLFVHDKICFVNRVMGLKLGMSKPAK